MAAQRPLKFSLVVLAASLAGCGGSTGKSGTYVPKYPDNPVMPFEKLEFRSGNQVAITAFGTTQIGQYTVSEDGTMRVTMPEGGSANFRDIGGGCLLAVSDPALVAEAAKDGVDLNELGQVCRD